MTEFARRRGKNGVLHRLCLASVIGCAVAATAWAQAPEKMHDYTLPAASLTQSVNAIGQSNGVQVIYEAALLKGKLAGPISGHFTLSQALDKALAGSGLTYELVNDGHTVVIRKAPLPPQKNSSTAPSNNATKTKENVEPTTLSTVAVTGTRIRGGVTASPTITITARQIHDEGFTDLGEVIRSIPQNFSGGQNPGVNTGATIGGIANQNFSGGSGLNLRGLGPDATLTLLNGRRLVYDSFAQAVDISAIPIEAVERIEIVPDGASAIYGSDAVGGVGNVILKRDFEGVTLGALYGSATEGGLNTREYTATAGTIWGSGGLIATYKNSSSDPIFSDQRDYTTTIPSPKTLYPGLDSYSGLFSAHQSFGDLAELRLDALKTHREQEAYVGTPNYFYSYPYDTTVSLVSPSIEFSLPRDWSLTVGGSYGKSDGIKKDYYVTSVASTLTGEYCYCNKSYSYEVGAEGPLFNLAGGDAQLAIGVGSRTDKIQIQVRSSTPVSQYGGDARARYAYAELSLPFVSAASDITGIHRLEISVAARGEHYDSFGQVTTPKLGLIYEPNADFTFRVSWGKSFKAPTLEQRYELKYAYLYPASQFGSGYASDATVLWTFGGNTNLQPERARTWTPSLVFHPEALPNLGAELTWFDIDYTDRVVEPIGDSSHVLGDPDYAEFVSYSPTAEEQAGLLAIYNNFYNYTGVAYEPSKVVSIIRNNYVNAARQRIKGFDLSGSYGMGLGDGHLTFRGSASWLKSSQQVSADQPEFEMAGNIYYPAKFKSRFGAVWTEGGFSASGFLNHTAGVTSNLVGSTEKTASFTTVDVTLRYDIGKRSDALSGMEFVLSAENLFNRDPPFNAVPTIYFPPYDSTNYSAIGRYVSVSIAKHW